MTYAFDLLIPGPRAFGFTLRDATTGFGEKWHDPLVYGSPDSRAVFADIETWYLDLDPDDSEPARLYVLYGLLFADTEVRHFLEGESGATFDVKRVQAVHPVGGALPDGRWAMRVTTRVDCVNLGISGASNDREKLNLAHVMQQPDPRLWKLRHLVVDESLIPRGVRLLELGNWWGALLIERAFAEALTRRFPGGVFGDGLGTLRLPDVLGSWGRMMYETR